MFAAMKKKLQLICLVHHPAGRIIGRIDQHRLGVRGQAIYQPVHIQMPAAIYRLQRNNMDIPASDFKTFRQVRPCRANHNNFIPRVGKGLCGQHHRLHTRSCHRDSRYVQCQPVKPVHIILQAGAQSRFAAIGLIEVIALCQRVLGSAHCNFRSRPSPFAKPEPNNICPAHSGFGNFSYQARLQGCGAMTAGIHKFYSHKIDSYKKQTVRIILS